MCKRELCSIFYFSYEIFRKTDSLQEFLREQDVVKQISPHDWWKAHFKEKDVDFEQKKLRKQYCSFIQQLLPQLQLSVFFQHMVWYNLHYEIN